MVKYPGCVPHPPINKQKVKRKEKYRPSDDGSDGGEGGAGGVFVFHHCVL